MLHQIFLIFTGIFCGTVVASGIAGLLIGLSIIPRYAGITHTASHLLLYEDMVFFGTLCGNLFYLFEIPLPLGLPFLIIAGLFFGIYLGSWILALAEIISVFPVFSRRIQLTEGFSSIIISIASGKILGCLFFFFFGQK